MPPSAEATIVTREVSRSTSSDRYSSRAIWQPASTYTRFTRRPAGPVCLVTSVWPIIASAAARTSSSDRARRTPPLPFGSSAKRPAPRPPAWICDFTTNTGPGSFRAASTASSGVHATWPSKTATP